MYVVNHERRYLIYMFPKAGCSTLRVLHAYLTAPRSAWGTEFFEDRHHGIQRRDDNSMLANWERYHDYAKVLVYRNPYERVVSLFFQKVCGVPAVTFRGRWYEEPIRLRPDMRTFAQFVDVLVTGHYHSDEHFCPQRMPPCRFDQVLELRSVATSLFAGLRPDLAAAVQDVLTYTQRTAWNEIPKTDHPPESLADYDFYRDPDGLLTTGQVPCYAAMLTPAIRRTLDTFYHDDFTEKHKK